MTFQTILTSKGTTTIPKEIRDKLDIQPGSLVTFSQNQSGEFVIGRAPTIKELRIANKQALQKSGTWKKLYKSGYGFTAHVREKYGD